MQRPPIGSNDQPRRGRAPSWPDADWGGRVSEEEEEEGSEEESARRWVRFLTKLWRNQCLRKLWSELRWFLRSIKQARLAA